MLHNSYFKECKIIGIIKSQGIQLKYEPSVWKERMPLSFNHQQQKYYSIIKKIWVLANITNHHQSKGTHHKSKWHHSSVLSATFVISNDASVDDDSHKISQNVSPNTIYLVVVCVPRLITLLNDCLNHLHTKTRLV